MQLRKMLLASGIYHMSQFKHTVTILTQVHVLMSFKKSKTCSNLICGKSMLMSEIKQEFIYWAEINYSLHTVLQNVNYFSSMMLFVLVKNDFIIFRLVY